jgi:tetratricopeptide (TPR) repeat protein
MTTHIFVALGMWDDVVSQNIVAAGLTGWWPGHYTAWLEYGYAQQGRSDTARAHLERAWRNLGDSPSTGRRAYLSSMRAHYLVNTRRWADPVIEWEIDLSGASAVAKAKDAFALGYAAFEQGDREAAANHLATLSELTEADDDAGWYGGNRSVPAILEAELAAMMLLADGAADEALTSMREATALEDAMPMEYGPPDVVKPSHELLGEMLAALGRPAEAQAEFERALALAPRRALSLAGLEHAAHMAGDHATAGRAHVALGEVWHDADPALLQGTH